MKTCEHGFDYEKWPNHVCEKCRVKAYRRKNKEHVNAGLRAWRKANPDFAKTDPDYKMKRNARAMVMKALQDGRLIRPDCCSECKVTCKPEAHHHDYLQPLNVTWLCTLCHVIEETK